MQRQMLLLALPRAAVQPRFALLKHLNQCVQTSLALLDLRDSGAPWTLALLLRLLSHCAFFYLKSACRCGDRGDDHSG